MLQKMHEQGICFQKLTPKKILTYNPQLIEQKNDLFLSDFKYCRVFRHMDKISYSEKVNNKTLLTKFSSINTHLGACKIYYNLILLEGTNKDDLESLGYILLYFQQNGFYKLQSIILKGNLFCNIEEENVSKVQNILKQKIDFIPETSYMNFPKQFADYFNYLKYLPCDADLDYKFLRNLFKSMLKQANGMITKIPNFEWCSNVKSKPTNLIDLNPNNGKMNSNSKSKLLNGETLTLDQTTTTPEKNEKAPVKKLLNFGLILKEVDKEEQEEKKREEEKKEKDPPKKKYNFNFRNVLDAMKKEDNNQQNSKSAEKKQHFNQTFTFDVKPTNEENIIILDEEKTYLALYGLNNLDNFCVIIRNSLEQLNSKFNSLKD